MVRGPAIDEQLPPGLRADQPVQAAGPGFDLSDEPMVDTVEGLAGTLERVLSWVRRATDSGGLSIVALSTLAVLDSRGPLRLSELVARERITQPGMTGLVTRLSDAGLVTREPDPADGRASLVMITDSGRRRVADVHAQRARALATHLRDLPPVELAALLSAAGALDSLAALPIRAGGS